jgi:hypothetical protein
VSFFFFALCVAGIQLLFFFFGCLGHGVRMKLKLGFIVLGFAGPSRGCCSRLFTPFSLSDGVRHFHDIGGIVWLICICPGESSGGAIGMSIWAIPG